MVYRQASVHKSLFRNLPLGAAFVFSSNSTSTPLTKDSRNSYRNGNDGSVPVTDLSVSVILKPLLGRGSDGASIVPGDWSQVLSYSVNPTTEGKIPLDQNLPAICYQVDGLDATYTWNTTTHVWE